MWCEKTKNGKVRFVERYTDPLTEEEKKVSIVMNKNTASTRKEASDALQDKIEQQIGKSMPMLKKDNLTILGLVRLYREWQINSVTQSTYRRNYHATNMIMRLLGENTLVSNLTAGYVKSSFSRNGDKPGTINERYARFKAFIRWGYENDYISDIRYIDKIKPLPDKHKKEKLQDKYLEREELKTLIDAMKVIHWKYLTEMLALSGMRCGEAIALEMTDVDIKNNVIHVTKTFDPVNEIVTPPKTLCSVRDIYMQPELRDLCKEIKKYSLNKKMQCGYRSNLFLCDINGNYLKYYSYNKYLKYTSIKAIGYCATTHVMRHTHVSLLAEAGVPIETITRRVGHEHSQVTRDVYMHVTNKLKEKDNLLMQKVNLL